MRVLTEMVDGSKVSFTNSKLNYSIFLSKYIGIKYVCIYMYVFICMYIYVCIYMHVFICMCLYACNYM